MKTRSLTLVLIVAIMQLCTSQNHEEFKAINETIWKPFSEAFETQNYTLFESIHSKELIRVSGNNKKHIKGLEAYMENYKKNWKGKTRPQTISFRFIERIVSNEYASERGIYKLTINPNTEGEKSFYGKFHVILKKEESIWKLVVDYDSNENNTIDESSYNSAKEINDFDGF